MVTITVHEDTSHLALESGWLGVVHSEGFLERNFYSATWGTTFLAAYCHPHAFYPSPLPATPSLSRSRPHADSKNVTLKASIFGSGGKFKGHSQHFLACLSGEYVCVHVQTRASACPHVFSNTYMKFPGRGIIPCGSQNMY